NRLRSSFASIRSSPSGVCRTKVLRYVRPRDLQTASSSWRRSSDLPTVSAGRLPKTDGLAGGDWLYTLRAHQDVGVDQQRGWVCLRRDIVRQDGPVARGGWCV